jgi:hypothetical protein
MSGGSFDYACYKVEDNRVFDGIEEYKRMEQYLRDVGKHEAADEVYRYINIVETYQRRLAIEGKRIYDLLYSVEWTASGDTGIEAIDYAYNKLINPDEKTDAKS